MSKKSSKDTYGQLSDKKKTNKVANSGNTLHIPINRNLSTRLFGQLWTLKDRTS